MLGGFLEGATAQPGIDMPRRLLAMADRDRDRALARHHVAAGKYAWIAGHHVGRDDYGTIGLELDFWNLAQKAAVGLLSERQHDGVCLQGFELACGLRAPFIVNMHHFDSHLRSEEGLDSR